MKKPAFISIISVIAISLLSLLAVGGSSCRRMSDNSKIDGYWKIKEIQYDDGSVVNPTQKFIAIQLELLQLQDPLCTSALTAVISYHKGDDEIGVDFRYNPSDELLAQYGFKGAQSVLHIDHLSGSRLVLRSSIATIHCQKF